MKIKKYVRQLLPVIAFFVIIFGLTAGSLGSEKKEYSETEKRELQQMPKVRWRSVRKGKFQKKYEKYLADQFPGRDSWVRLQTDVSRVVGKTESNGVYFGKDGYLLEHYGTSDFENEQSEKNEQALVKFVKKMSKKRNISVMLVPTKTWIMQEKLPAFAPTYDEQQMYDCMKAQLGDLADTVLVPVADELQKHTDEQIYYRTDHHWTTLGAWYGYEAYVRAAGGDLEQAQKKRDFHCVSTQFYGSTYAKVNQAPRADEIEMYEPQQPLTVVYNMGEKTTDTLYDTSFLDTQDQYSYFTGGNQPVIEVTGGTANGRTLLVIKDSFGNSMIPFLVEDYEKVVMVDLRQLNVKCKDLVNMFDPTDVLLLYNTAQFAGDRDFAMKCK